MCIILWTFAVVHAWEWEPVRENSVLAALQECSQTLISVQTEQRET